MAKVVPKHKIGRQSSEDTITYLRDRLSDLHYETLECSICGSVENEDDFEECAECRGYLCDYCTGESQSIAAIKRHKLRKYKEAGGAAHPTEPQQDEEGELSYIESFSVPSEEEEDSEAEEAPEGTKRKKRKWWDVEPEATTTTATSTKAAVFCCKECYADHVNSK